MKDLKEFNIHFVGFKEGIHLFSYEIDNTFFEAFNYDEFLSSAIKIDLNFTKKSTHFELDFSATGSVTIPCDTTNEPFDMEVSPTLSMIVKFGPEFNDDNEDIITIAYEANKIDVSQYIYEMIILSIPQKRVHPNVLDGTMQSEALSKLEELKITTEKKVSEETDPRWDKLKNITTEKNT
ncbi:DUF177 domain-containing protein [Polaribacter sp. HL-MS24]|uniref:YceD family protein n=1 Tax=Polaribacter sp. HL-MS24 TaxID=3077735 RepID=UPI002934F095|nr:DUF177 domain-containing protein [Polaribacter sp. HL-MS24]WOC40940.1 DUF177 domain-containing protein [Polaribacter sp. HL-MS24]